jgi:hypothetical protein
MRKNVLRTYFSESEIKVRIMVGESPHRAGFGSFRLEEEDGIYRQTLENYRSLAT